MESYGIVQEVFEKKARVRFLRQSSCGENCGACSGCSKKELDALVDNPLGAQPGDQVQVESDSKKVLLGAFLLYIMPLFILFAVYGIASLFLDKGIAAIFSGVSFFAWFAWMKKLGNSLGVAPVITRIVKRDENIPT